jgi:hypothetical protein
LREHPLQVDHLEDEKSPKALEASDAVFQRNAAVRQLFDSSEPGMRPLNTVQR